MRGDELFELVQFVAGDFLGVEQALHHGRERAIEGVFERIKQFATLGLFSGHGGAVKRDVLFPVRGEQLFADHAIHQGAHGGIRPRRLRLEFFLNGGGGAGFAVPDGLDDGPFGFGEFNRFFRHGDDWV